MLLVFKTGTIGVNPGDLGVSRPPDVFIESPQNSTNISISLNVEEYETRTLLKVVILQKQKDFYIIK